MAVSTWGVSLLISWAILEVGRRNRVKRTTVAWGLVGAVIGYFLAVYRDVAAINGLPELSGYAWACWAIGLALRATSITQDWRASRSG